MIDLKADQDEIKEVLGNEYQDYNLERYQQTVIHRIANVDGKHLADCRVLHNIFPCQRLFLH